MQATVLILGARGRFGLAAARAFAQAGWRVIGQMRQGASAPAENGVHWLGVDLHDSAALAHAAQGAAVVVHALNPVYTNRAWAEQALPMLEASIALSRALGATLMLPGNVYNFGSNMPAVLREDTPQAAHTVKGKIRMAMEARLQASGVRSVIVRAGDFFGSGSGTGFDRVLVKDIAKGSLTLSGEPDVGTAWAYLPDLARTFVAVAEKRLDLPPYAVLHYAGYQISPQQWADVLNPVARAQQWIGTDAQLQLRRMPWGLLRLVSVFVRCLPQCWKCATWPKHRTPWPMTNWSR